MGKIIVYSKGLTLQGVFSTEKNMWDDLIKRDQSPNSLMIKTSKTKAVPLKYGNISKYLKERKMLRIYKKRAINNSIKDGNIESCPSTYSIWLCEVNTHYTLKKSL